MATFYVSGEEKLLKVKEEDLDKVSGGALVREPSYLDRIYSITLSKEEYQSLKGSGLLDEEGNLHHNNRKEAINYLRASDFKVNYKWDMGGLAAHAARAAEEKLRKENPVIKLIIG